MIIDLNKRSIKRLVHLIPAENDKVFTLLLFSIGYDYLHKRCLNMTNNKMIFLFRVKMFL